MTDSHELYSSSGLKGQKWAIKKICRGIFGGKYHLWLTVNDDGLPDYYTEYSGNAWWGTKRQAEKLLKILKD